MPVFECKILGDDKPRVVKAKTGAQAAKHIVDVNSVSAERLAELVADGATIEVVGDPAPAPAKPEANK